MAVYMPACVNRIFGPPASNGSRLAAHPRTNGSELPLPEAMVAVSARAGMPVWIPDDVAGSCCSVPWTSKGYTEGAALMERDAKDKDFVSDAFATAKLIAYYEVPKTLIKGDGVTR